jgi:hypothetical protein
MPEALKHGLSIPHASWLTDASLMSHITPRRRPQIAMNPSTITVLRANAVLLAVSVGVSVITWSVLAWLAGVPQTSAGNLSFKALTLAAAIMLMLFVRRLAKRAFEEAHRQGHIAIRESGRIDSDSIGDRCPDAWLVQLHIELHAAPMR